MDLGGSQEVLIEERNMKISINPWNNKRLHTGSTGPIGPTQDLLVKGHITDPVGL